MHEEKLEPYTCTAFVSDPTAGMRLTRRLLVERRNKYRPEFLPYFTSRLYSVEGFQRKLQRLRREKMCGRGRCTLGADGVSRACYRNGDPTRSVHVDRYRPSYNVSPGSNVPVIRRDNGSGEEGFAVHCMKWGLVPSFTQKTEKPDHYKMFNARSESVSEKVSFRRLLPKSRCLVAFEGFYEWKKDSSKKQPYYIHFKDGRPLVFAALYDSWESSEGEVLYTFTILTTTSSSALQWLHDRMPVILADKESTDAWLNGSSSSKFESMLKPYDKSDLVWHPVTAAMGKPSFDGPECIKEIQLKPEGKALISKFFSPKGVHKEQGSSTSEEKVSCIKPVKNNMTSSLKAEPAMDEEDSDSKSSVSMLTHEGEAKCKTKRDYDEFVTDTKPAIIGTYQSPAKKKTTSKSTGDKQPTLFSYFGKN